MKKILAFAMGMFIILSSFTHSFALEWGAEHEGEHTGYGYVYSDVSPEHWAYEETKRCKEKGWFSGYPDGRFMPDASITRAEAIKVFVSFLGRELNDIRISNYHDVDVNAWYAPYIHAGEDLFAPKWKNGGAFQPDMPMTREDTVYALVVALGYDTKTKFADESVLNMFTDKNSITNTMRSYFAVAVSSGLVSGYNDNTIRAQDALTRAQFAALLYRASFVSPEVKPTAKLQTITITPSFKQTLTVGDSFTFSGKATYSDKTTKAYNELNPYDADYSGVVRIDGNTITAVKAGSCTIKFNCDYTEPSYVAVSVTNPTDAPKLKLYYDNTTYSDTMEITGTVTDSTNTEVDLTCNGKDIRVNNGNFSYTINLILGINNFEFTATNAYGNTTTKNITITREKEEPDTVTVEGVIGKNRDTAKNILESLGLKVTIETAWDNNVAEGTVISQSISGGTEIEIGKNITITVSGGKNDWVGWIDSLPSYVNQTDYIVEEKTQYRYKTLEKTTSNSQLNGWTLIGTNEQWGSWSSWSRSSVSSSSTREVETRSVADPQQTKTQWHYTRYYGYNPSKGGNVSWPWQGTYSRTYQESGWLDSPYQNRGKADNVDATCWYNGSDSISPWWWNETTRTVTLPTTYHNEYRYRDKSVSYNYERWTDFSDWQDNAVSENDRNRVETRKVYRYKFK